MMSFVTKKTKQNKTKQKTNKKQTNKQKTNKQTTQQTKTKTKTFSPHRADILEPRSLHNFSMYRG